jgi:hypothetical protein
MPITDAELAALCEAVLAHCTCGCPEDTTRWCGACGLTQDATAVVALVHARRRAFLLRIAEGLPIPR